MNNKLYLLAILWIVGVLIGLYSIPIIQASDELGHFSTNDFLSSRDIKSIIIRRDLTLPGQLPETYYFEGALLKNYWRITVYANKTMIPDLLKDMPSSEYGRSETNYWAINNGNYFDYPPDDHGKGIPDKAPKLPNSCLELVIKALSYGLPPLKSITMSGITNFSAIDYNDQHMNGSVHYRNNQIQSLQYTYDPLFDPLTKTTYLRPLCRFTFEYNKSHDFKYPTKVTQHNIAGPKSTLIETIHVISLDLTNTYSLTDLLKPRSFSLSKNWSMNVRSNSFLYSIQTNGAMIKVLEMP